MNIKFNINYQLVTGTPCFSLVATGYITELIIMDIKLAEDIKHWRCVKGATWRKVAHYAAEVYPDRGFLDGNQIEGQELCFEAAKFLGEDSRDMPWNY